MRNLDLCRLCKTQMKRSSSTPLGTQTRVHPESKVKTILYVFNMDGQAHTRGKTLAMVFEDFLEVHMLRNTNLNIFTTLLYTLVF